MRNRGRHRPGASLAPSLLRVLATLALLVGAGCAAKAPPALPATLAHPDFVFPTVPAALRSERAVASIDAGWRFLQNGDERGADREFAQALGRVPGLYPALTGQGYVALARRDPGRAQMSFEQALQRDAQYVPALVGRGQALLAINRETDALQAFQAALALDGSLTDLQRRVDVLTFRSVQSSIEQARASAAEGRLDEARASYLRALTSSPDSGFLYRELGILESRQGNREQALEHLRRAAVLDPSDAVAWVQIGEVLEQQLDFAGAETAYRTAQALDPSPALATRVDAVAALARDAQLPSEFRAIPSAMAMTRGDLAALVGIRLESVLERAPRRDEVLTDIRGHWAAPWITPVARAGVIEAFDNHTFQPRASLRRVELATAVSRIVALLAQRQPALRASLTERPRMADVSTAHLNYRDIATAVASGVLTLEGGDRFDVSRLVPGQEAIDAVTRLTVLASRAP